MQIINLLENEVVQALETFKPEAIIIAAGFDAHAEDDMSGLCYSTGLYRELGRKIRQWETRFCPGRLLSVLEGGYELTALAESVEAYLDGLCS